MHCLTVSLVLSCHVASLLPPGHAFKGLIRLPARRSASLAGAVSHVRLPNWGRGLGDPG